MAEMVMSWQVVYQPISLMADLQRQKTSIDMLNFVMNLLNSS